MPVKKKISRKNTGRLSILYCLGLLLAVSSALPAYIQSNFLGEFVNVQTVSLFFVIANFLSIMAILLFPSLIKAINNYSATKAVLAIYLASLFGLSLVSSAGLALISITLFTITSSLIWINMDVLIESFSNNKATGKIRTIYFTFINVGWILSPLLSSYLIEKGQYTLTFLVAAFMVIPFYLILISQGKKLKDRVEYQKEELPVTLQKMWDNKNLRGIFFIALLLSLFYSSAVIYIPIHLHRNLGMDWHTLGIIFSIMLIPFILIEIPAGIIADKYLGEKELLLSGFVILILSLFLFYLIKTPNLWLWALVLFLSRTGAALIEAMRETYFFKIVDVEEVSYINIFRVTTPLGYVVGAELAVMITNFFPLNYLFLFLAIVMLSGFWFIASIKDTK